MRFLYICCSFQWGSQGPPLFAAVFVGSLLWRFFTPGSSEETLHLVPAKLDYISTSLGLWGSLGGVEEVLLASTIIHSLAAPFYIFCIFNACLGYTCIFAQPSGDGVGVGRIVFSILLLLVLDLSGAVFSGALYNNVPAAKNNTTSVF